MGQGSIVLTEHPVQVAVGAEDEEGCLIFANDRLVAVLVRLSRRHEEMAGRGILGQGLASWMGLTSPRSETSAQQNSGSPSA
jgi:hypothetical protein